MQQTLFKVRDLRQKTQFKIDDKYINGYARYCGENATLVYISLCRHAEFNSQKAFPSQEKIAWEHGISKRSVIRGLKKLVEYNIVIVEKEYRKGKFSNNLYVLLDKSEWKPSDSMAQGEPSDKNRVTPTAYGQSHTKDNKVLRITKIKDNKEGATPSVAGKEVNDLLELFGKTNPSYKQLFKNKSERAALERLVKQHGRAKVENMIKAIETTNKTPFAPTITTPYMLEKKLGDLMAFIQKEKSKAPQLIKI